MKKSEEFQLNTQYENYKCIAVLANYQANNAIALELIDAKEGYPIARPTMNLRFSDLNGLNIPSEKLESNHCYMKEEVKGVLNSLEEADIIKRTGTIVGYGPYDARAELVQIQIDKFK